MSLPFSAHDRTDVEVRELAVEDVEPLLLADNERTVITADGMLNHCLQFVLPAELDESLWNLVAFGGEALTLTSGGDYGCVWHTVHLVSFLMRSAGSF